MRPIIIITILCFLFESCGNQNLQHYNSNVYTLSYGEPELNGFSAEGLEEIDHLLLDAMNENIIGGGVAFIARRGEIVYFKATGYDNPDLGIPLNKDGIFRIASQTKAITSVAVMMLYEQGLLSLDDPVSDYLPDFKDSQILVDFNSEDSSYTSRSTEREIQIRDLLTHTSGYCYPGGGSREMNAVYSKRHIPGGVPVEPSLLEEEMHKIANLPLQYEPGTRFSYGLSTDILGYLIECISGMSLEKFFRKNIFNPLGMDDTYFYLPEGKQSRLMTLYTQKGSRLIPADKALSDYPKNPRIYNSGGGGLSSTAMDYAVFLQMLLNGGSYGKVRLLKEETVKLMTQNQIGDIESGSLFIPRSGSRFGYGFEIIPENMKRKTPIPPGSFGWGGAFGSLYWVDKENEMIVHFVIQKSGEYNPLRYAFIEKVYDAMSD